MTQDYQGQQAPQAPQRLVLPEAMLQKWRDGLCRVPTASILRTLADRAATWAWEQAMTTLAEREQAAADAELEACCAWLEPPFPCISTASSLRAARRPKPPSLAEKGLAALAACSIPTEAEYVSIRDALLRLQELEQVTTTTTTETTND
jgi:hypothetical protein